MTLNINIVILKNYLYNKYCYKDNLNGNFDFNYYLGWCC